MVTIDDLLKRLNTDEEKEQVKKAYEFAAKVHKGMKRLTKDDYSPIESELLKDHYRNSFLKLLDKVSKKIIHLYNKDREKK